MRNYIKFRTILAILLFAVSQGAFAQTEQKELNEVTSVLKELQMQMVIIKRDQMTLQRLEHVINSHRFSGAPITSTADLSLLNKTLPIPPEYYDAFRGSEGRQEILQWQAEQLIIRRTELQKQENVIKQQQEVLQKREAEIKSVTKQQEVK